MWRHYHKGTTKIEATKFWAILPPSAGTNIVPFQTVASAAD
jgi:hypothetical protein